MLQCVWARFTIHHYNLAHIVTHIEIFTWYSFYNTERHCDPFFSRYKIICDCQVTTMVTLGAIIVVSSFLMSATGSKIKLA